MKGIGEYQESSLSLRYTTRCLRLLRLSSDRKPIGVQTWLHTAFSFWVPLTTIFAVGYIVQAETRLLAEVNGWRTTGPSGPSVIGPRSRHSPVAGILPFTVPPHLTSEGSPLTFLTFEENPSLRPTPWETKTIILNQTGQTAFILPSLDRPCLVSSRLPSRYPSYDTTTTPRQPCLDLGRVSGARTARCPANIVYEPEIFVRGSPGLPRAATIPATSVPEQPTSSANHGATEEDYQGDGTSPEGAVRLLTNPYQVRRPRPV